MQFQKLSVWLLAFFLLTSFQANASWLGTNLPKLNELKTDEVFLTIMQKLRENPALLELADNKERVLIEGKEGKELFSADLILTDIIDQVHFHLEKKNEKELEKKLRQILGAAPLKNFLAWEKAISEAGPGNKNLRRAMAKVVVQLYDHHANPLMFKMDLLRTGRFSRYERTRRLKQYNDLMHDPEGSRIVYYIHQERQKKILSGADLGVFPTTRPTVTKYWEHKKEFNKKYKVEYYDYYYQILAQQEVSDHLGLEKKELVNFKFKFRPKKSKPITITSMGKSEKEFKNVSAQIFNTIQSLPYKGALQIHLRTQLKEQFNIDVPTVVSRTMEHYLFTPSFIHKHRFVLLPLIKEYTYLHLYNQSDAEYLLHLRKWVRSHHEEIDLKAKEANLPFTIPHRMIGLPHIAEVAENFEIILQLYPQRPWDQGMPVLYDAAGRPVYLTDKVHRFFFKVRDYLKDLVAIENISSLVVGGAVYALTGNPMLSAMAGALTRDSIRAVKYDIPVKQAIPMILKDVAISAILGAGFSSGRLAEQIILGGLAGAAESIVIQRRVDVGAIVGAIQGIVTGLLPRGIAHPTIAGLTTDVAFKNALIELLETAAYRGVHGLVVSLVTNYDRTWTFGNQVIADSDTPGNTDVEAHELSHRMQNRNFGIIGFNTRYVLEFFKNGTHGTATGGNVFENYLYIPWTHGNAGVHAANAGSPLGMRIFEGALGTTGGMLTGN
jgi:hypothetical protein